MNVTTHVRSIPLMYSVSSGGPARDDRRDQHDAVAAGLRVAASKHRARAAEARPVVDLVRDLHPAGDLCGTSCSPSGSGTAGGADRRTRARRVAPQQRASVLETQPVGRAPREALARLAGLFDHHDAPFALGAGGPGEVAFTGEQHVDLRAQPRALAPDHEAPQHAAAGVRERDDRGPQPLAVTLLDPRDTVPRRTRLAEPRAVLVSRAGAGERRGRQRAPAHAHRGAPVSPALIALIGTSVADFAGSRCTRQPAPRTATPAPSLRRAACINNGSPKDGYRLKGS